MSKYEFSCTDCGGDATVGMSALKETGKKGYIIKPNERLCRKCVIKRTGKDILNFNK